MIRLEIRMVSHSHSPTGLQEQYCPVRVIGLDGQIKKEWGMHFLVLKIFF